METKPSPDLLVAQTLAAPYSPRSQGIPLSFKPLPDGGMVVITSDGRKLWFTAIEVQAARRQLKEKTGQKNVNAPPLGSRFPVKLTASPAEDTFRPTNGFPIQVAAPESSKKKP
jgi:hypothetical protein